LCPNRRKQPVD